MAWNRAYRSLEHGDARRRFRHAGHMEHFPRAVREFADTFNELQRERQTADYNPDYTFTLSGALRIIDHARQAIIRFAGASWQPMSSSATAPNRPDRPLSAVKEWT